MIGLRWAGSAAPLRKQRGRCLTCLRGVVSLTSRRIEVWLASGSTGDEMRLPSPIFGRSRRALPAPYAWLAPWLRARREVPLRSDSEFGRGYRAAINEVLSGVGRQHFKRFGPAKRGFFSEAEAEAFIATFNQLRDHYCTYRCGLCGEWHIATVHDASAEAA